MQNLTEKLLRSKMKIKKMENLHFQNSLLKTKKYYLIYARKSSESEDRQMQSIDDQLNVLQDLIKSRNLPVLKIFKESKSAKDPGRLEYNQMIQTIQSRNDIKGVVCWSLNRLSRNPLDSGQLQWILQNNAIEEIVTPTKTYTEFDSDFVMAIEGAQANRFIRDLRKDTIRGLNSKLEKGQAPYLATTGYQNNKFNIKGEKDISPHPTYFPLVRKVFELALTRQYSVRDLRDKAEELRIQNNRGRIISKTHMYKCLRNPFYTGKFLYKGQLYQGSHKPMITESEFDLIQDYLDGRGHPRKIKHDFPLTGLIRCGECQMMITAESHTKVYKNGTSQVFTYYHCTRKNKATKCSQPYVSDTELEAQVVEFLGGISISKRFVDWAVKYLNVINDSEVELRDVRQKALQASYDNVVKKLDNLLQLKISPLNTDGSLISDEEFQKQKSVLIKEKDRVYSQLSKLDQGVEEWVDLTAKTFDFAATAQDRFKYGTLEDKKTILQGIGSNLVLKDKKLEIQPRIPFLLIQEALSSIQGTETSLEPKQYIDTGTKVGDLVLENSQWGDVGDLHPC